MYQNSNIGIEKTNIKDNFHSFLVKNCTYDGIYDIPVMKSQDLIIPKNLVAYTKTNNYIYENGDFVHFYLDDSLFDGHNGIWNTIRDNLNNKRGFNITKINGASGIIAPDYSLYMDMPRVMQIWNVYRSRAVGCFLQSKGFIVIPNIRWTDRESYNFAFAGVEYGSAVSVGSLGCIKNKYDHFLFVSGFIEMLKRINPILVIIYGTISSELLIILKKYDVNFLNFESIFQSIIEVVDMGFKHKSNLFTGTNGQKLHINIQFFAEKKISKKGERLLAKVKDDKLKNVIKELFRPGASIGNGGTADAIRYEIKNGITVGEKSHILKGIERIKNLDNILKLKGLSKKDRKIAEKLKKDLEKALGDKYVK